MGPEEGVEPVGIIRGGARQIKLNDGVRQGGRRRKGVERIEVGLSSPAEGEGRRGRDLCSGLGLAKGTAGTRVKTAEKWEQKWRRLRGGAMGGAM